MLHGLTSYLGQEADAAESSEEVEFANPDLPGKDLPPSGKFPPRHLAGNSAVPSCTEQNGGKRRNSCHPCPVAGEKNGTHAD